MAEAAGLSYFAEIPAVIWNVQRLGPSTGLPTRTSQGDLLSAHTLSHGDTKHVVLMPGTMQECYDFGIACFDLSEELQTLVVVLSDLDLGMNTYISDEIIKNKKAYNRGQIEQVPTENFNRYKTTDTGVSPRSLPGNSSVHASYFTRGTSHDEEAKYSESAEDYEKVIEKLQKKWAYAAKIIPKPIINNTDSDMGLIYYGSSLIAVNELQKTLGCSTARVRALPLTQELKEFIKSHKNIYVVEQNSTAQMHQLVSLEWPELAHKLTPLTFSNGLPLSAKAIKHKLEARIV